MKIFFKKKLLVAALVPVIGMPVAVSSFAQSTAAQEPRPAQQQPTQRSPQQQQAQPAMQQQQRQPGQQAAQATTIRDMRASKLVGANVQNPRGESLGEIQDLIVNSDNGRVDYAILAFGGAAGFGEKLFAYPINKFQAASTGDGLILNVSEQQMRNAPGFDRSNWPSFGAGGYRGQVAKHFGQPATAGGNMVRMSEMLNNRVVDRSGIEVGQINDAVVSVTDGRIRYVTLDPVQDLNMGDRLVMLPANAIRATGEQQFERQLQSQQRQAKPGQPSQQAQQQAQQRQAQQAQQQAPQQAQQQRQAQQSQQQRGQQQQAQQAQDQDLLLVLTVEPRQLQQARTMQQDQWPDLNNPAFQREMDRYVASFPAGGQARSTTAGGSGPQEQFGAGQQEPMPQQPQQHQPSTMPQQQERMQQPQPGVGEQPR